MTKNERLQSMADEYRGSGAPWPASAKTIALWALDHGMTTDSKNLLVNQLAEDIARALREEYYIDPQGRSVRAKHAARIEVNGRQETLWDDHRTMEAAFMKVSAQNRREQIVGDCMQLKTDVDSFNENRMPAEPIQVVFDFTLDLLEREALAKMDAAA